MQFSKELLVVPGVSTSVKYYMHAVSDGKDAVGHPLADLFQAAAWCHYDKGSKGDYRLQLIADVGVRVVPKKNSTLKERKKVVARLAEFTFANARELPDALFCSFARWLQAQKEKKHLPEDAFMTKLELSCKTLKCEPSSTGVNAKRMSKVLELRARVSLADSCAVVAKKIEACLGVCVGEEWVPCPVGVLKESEDGLLSLLKSAKKTNFFIWRLGHEDVPLFVKIIDASPDGLRPVIQKRQKARQSGDYTPLKDNPN